MESTPITQTRFFRQDTPPSGAGDGSVWVTDADGSGSDTTGRYVFNADADRWELDSAVGPSEPSLGTPVGGSSWRDTSEGAAKQYDGVGFVSLTPSATQPATVVETLSFDIAPDGQGKQTFSQDITADLIAASTLGGGPPSINQDLYLGREDAELSYEEAVGNTFYSLSEQDGVPQVIPLNSYNYMRIDDTNGEGFTATFDVTFEATHTHPL